MYCIFFLLVFSAIFGGIILHKAPSLQSCPDLGRKAITYISACLSAQDRCISPGIIKVGDKWSSFPSLPRQGIQLATSPSQMLMQSRVDPEWFVTRWGGTAYAATGFHASYCGCIDRSLQRPTLHLYVMCRSSKRFVVLVDKVAFSFM